MITLHQSTKCPQFTEVLDHEVGPGSLQHRHRAIPRRYTHRTNVAPSCRIDISLGIPDHRDLIRGELPAPRMRTGRDRVANYKGPIDVFISITTSGEPLVETHRSELDTSPLLHVPGHQAQCRPRSFQMIQTFRNPLQKADSSFDHGPLEVRKILRYQSCAKGIERFREHLGGSLAITMVTKPGVSDEVSHIDLDCMRQAIRLTRRRGADRASRAG